MPLSPPPRDDDGNVLPHDHPEIKNGDGIIRRISEQFVVRDANGNLRISSMAFSPSSGHHKGMSVDLEEEIRCAGLDPRAMSLSRTGLAPYVSKLAPYGLCN